MVYGAIQSDAIPSLCGMPDSAGTLHEGVGVAQAQVTSMAAGSLLTIPWGIKEGRSLAWGICPVPTHLHPHHYGRVIQGPDNLPTLCPAQLLWLN
jgi:hypothetical protein